MKALWIGIVVGVLLLAAVPVAQADLPSEGKVQMLYNMLAPSVVEVVGEREEFSPWTGQVEIKRVIGTGWVIEDEIVVTAEHVAHASKMLKVYTDDPNTAPMEWYSLSKWNDGGVGMPRERRKDLGLIASVLATDDLNDLGLLRVPKLPKVRKLVLGDSDKVQVGQFLIAIGNGLGLFRTLGLGIVTYVNRTLPDNSFLLEHMTQTQSMIYPGLSGGPLFNMQGEVVGMAEAGNNLGQGFATPSNVIRNWLPQRVRLKEWLSGGQ